MKRFDSRRKFSSVKLTRTFHMAYMGLWILIVSVCVALIDALMYRIYEQDAALVALSSGQLAAEQAMQPYQILTLLVIVTTAFIAAVILLAMITAHRVTGPYLAIRRTLTAIRDGDPAYRLHFRKGDGLDDLADLFNETMDLVTGEPRMDREEAERLA